MTTTRLDYFDEFIRRPLMVNLFAHRLQQGRRQSIERDIFILSCFAGQKIAPDWTWGQIIEFVEKTRDKLITEEHGDRWDPLTFEELRDSIQIEQPLSRWLRFAQERLFGIIDERKNELKRMLRKILKEPNYIEDVLSEVRKSANWRVKGVRLFEIETFVNNKDHYIQLKDDRYVLLSAHTKELRTEAQRILGRFGIGTSKISKLSVDNRSLEDFVGLLRRIR